MNCGKKHQFCNVEYECVECNDNADCQSDDKHCVDRKCEPLSVVACIDGQTKCENNEVSSCINKSWENKTKCPKECNEAKTDCAPVENVCTKGESVCEGKIFKTCNAKLNGFDSKTCYFTEPYCDDIKGCIKCRNSEDCNMFKPVCNTSTNTCHECAVDEKKCDGNVFKQCNKRQSGFDTTVCSKGTPLCDADKGCVECRNSDDCMVLGKPICNPSTNVCEAPVIACAKGETKCEGGIFRQCNADQSAYEDIMCGKTTPFCDPKKGCLQCRDSQDCDKDTPICNSSLNLCQGYGDSCSRVLQVCITERDIAKCTDGKWVGMSCAQNRVCDAFAGCIEKPTTHLHDFEQCTFRGSLKYNEGNCTAAYSPDFDFSSAIAVTEVIEGKSLKLDKNSHAKIMIPDGVGKLSVTLKPDEPGVFDFQIKINGQLALSVKDLKGIDGETLTRDDINLVGPIDIIIQTVEHMTIDNFDWTNYP